MTASYTLLLLSAALLVAPQRRSRLRHRTIRLVRWSWKRAAAPLACCAVLAMWVLPVSVVLATGLAGATFGARWRCRRQMAKESQDLGAVESGLEVVIGELRVGAHPVHAFAATAAEVGGTAGEAFAVVAARARFGANQDGTVSKAGSTAPQWGRIVRAWTLAHRHGLAVADLFEACRTDLQERQRFTSRVNAGLAGPRATAAVLTALPVLGIGLGQLIGARPIVVLCSGGAGGVLLVVGVVLACVGLLWCDRITGKALR